MIQNQEIKYLKIWDLVILNQVRIMKQEDKVKEVLNLLHKLNIISDGELAELWVEYKDAVKQIKETEMIKNGNG